MKILYITNIPSPYRIDFYNKLSESAELTVLFEARRAKGITFNWNDDLSKFTSIFLKDGDIEEKKIDWKILKYIKKRKYDLFVATNYSYHTELIAYLKMIFRRIPFVLEIDGVVAQEENFIKRSFKKFLLTKPRAYFSPSKNSDDILSKYGCKRENIYRYPFTSLGEKDVLKSPLSDEEKRAYKAKIGIPDNKTVLYVGRFIELKMIDILLKSMEGWAEKHTLVLVGGTADSEYMQQFKAYISDNVYITGFKTKEELFDYYGAADIFVLPTRSDVWGLVINEAMAFGLPVISTDKCGAALELIENGYNGYIVPVGDTEALAKSINDIFADEAGLAEYGKNSLKKIKAHTIEEMVRCHMKSFEEIIWKNCGK